MFSLSRYFIIFTTFLLLHCISTDTSVFSSSPTSPLCSFSFAFGTDFIATVSFELMFCASNTCPNAPVPSTLISTYSSIFFPTKL